MNLNIDLTELTDTELFIRFRWYGDTEAFNELNARLGGVVFFVSVKFEIDFSIAEDVLQATWHAFLTERHAVKPGRPFRSSFFRIALQKLKATPEVARPCEASPVTAQRLRRAVEKIYDFVSDRKAA